MFLDNLFKILPWILPVVIGASIGYITNAIAIKMLFRPLREKRFLGIRIPFTPGIIPRQRYDLSENIAMMVSNELITEDAIGRQLEKESFKTGIRVAVESLTEELINSNINDLDKEKKKLLLSSIDSFLSDTLFRLFNSHFFIYATRDVVERIILYLLDVDIKTGEWKEWLVEKIISILKERDTKRKIADSIHQGNGKLTSLLTPEVVRFLSEILKSFLPVLYEHLFTWLRSDAMKAELASKGKFLMRDVLDTLNILQKFIISAGQFDKTLEDKMPEIVEKVLNHFENLAYQDETVLGITESFSSALHDLGNKDLGNLITKKRILEYYDTIIEKLSESNILVKVFQELERWVSNKKDEPSVTLRNILIKKLHINAKDIVDFASNKLLEILVKKETAEKITEQIVGIIENFISQSKDMKLQEMFGIDNDKKVKIDNFLAESTIKLIKKRVPELVRSLDIRSLVIEKIDGLDVKDVEDLILKVISKQLKWINFFGAILGGLIGFSEVLIRMAGL